MRSLNFLGISRIQLAAGAFATALALPARAADVRFDCPRLDARQNEELAARVRLALRSSKTPPEAILVACDPLRAWVVWNGPPLELVQVREDGNLIEAVLDAIETRVREGSQGKSVAPPPAPEPEKSIESPKPLPHETPSLERPARVLPEKPYEAVGGLAVGGTAELPSDPLSLMAGPRLDVALGHGESARGGTDVRHAKHTD